MANNGDVGHGDVGHENDIWPYYYRDDIWKANCLVTHWTAYSEYLTVDDDKYVHLRWFILLYSIFSRKDRFVKKQVFWYLFKQSIHHVAGAFPDIWQLFLMPTSQVMTADNLFAPPHCSLLIEQFIHLDLISGLDHKTWHWQKPDFFSF